MNLNANSRPSIVNGPSIAERPMSEIDQENGRLRQAIGTLYDRIGTLSDRLERVRVQFPEGEDIKGEAFPASAFGSELRNHALSVESMTARVERLLAELAL